VNQTVNITNIKVENNTVINEGPRTQIIEQASGEHVQAVPVRELRRKHEAAALARQHVAPSTSPEISRTPARNVIPPRETNPRLETQRSPKESEVLAREPLKRNV